MRELGRRFWHRFFYTAATALAWLLFRACVRVRVRGRRNLPRSGAFLLVCNHISHFDPPLLATVVWRKCAWVVALDMYAHPAGRFFFHGIEAIPVDRERTDRRVFREMLRRAKGGEPVGLFPEAGIRSGSGSILGGAPVEEAVAAFAEMAGVPVVPAVMLGTDKLYCRAAWRWRTVVEVAFGEPLPPPGKGERAALAGRVGADMRALASGLAAAHGLGPDDFPKTAQERWAEERAKRAGPGAGR